MEQFCESRNGNISIMDTMAYIGVGANLPGLDGRSPMQTCLWALGLLDRLPDLKISRVSYWYKTVPIPPSDQPEYVNAVVALQVDPGMSLDSQLLLARLMSIETTCGRTRSEPNAARVLDLDLIAIGDTIQTVQTRSCRTRACINARSCWRRWPILPPAGFTRSLARPRRICCARCRRRAWFGCRQSPPASLVFQATPTRGLRCCAAARDQVPRHRGTSPRNITRYRYRVCAMS